MRSDDLLEMAMMTNKGFKERVQVQAKMPKDQTYKEMNR